MLQDMQGRSQSFPLTEGGAKTWAVMAVMLFECWRCSDCGRQLEIITQCWQMVALRWHWIMSSVRAIENL